MTSPHPHKELIDAITSGVAAEVCGIISGDWSPVDGPDHALHHGALYGWHRVRLKPTATHREKTVRYPVPMQVEPEEGAVYWEVHSQGVKQMQWRGLHHDLVHFNAGLCYEIHREADAREAWEARFGEGWK